MVFSGLERHWLLHVLYVMIVFHGHESSVQDDIEDQVQGLGYVRVEATFLLQEVAAALYGAGTQSRSYVD